MKMKKLLIGAFLGMFAVAGTAMVLPNYVSAEGSWETPDSTNMFNNDDLQ
jgi:hypothetical protein